MRRALLCVVPTVASLVLDPSASADAQAAPERRVAVLFLAVGGADAAAADALAELIISAVADADRATILGREELQAALGHDEERSVECVSSAACLGRVGVELGVDEVIAGTLGHRDGTWVFNVNRIDIRTGELVGRSFREVTGELGELADALQAAIPTLYAPHVQVARLVVTANIVGAEVVVDGVLVGVVRAAPLEIPNLAPGRHEVRVSGRHHEAWRRTVQLAPGATLQLEVELEPRVHAGSDISPLVWVGSVTAAIAGGAAAYFGISSQAEPDRGATRAADLAFVEDRRAEATLANVAFGGVAVGAAVALWGVLLSDFEPGERPRHTPPRAARGAGGLRW